jgi:N-acetylmuramoyl-L-alanine amidase
LVPEAMRAWHAGAGDWRGHDDINSRSIGIELDNNGISPFSQPLMEALEALLPTILSTWGIAPSGVIAHSDMAPGRKIDPGRRFDWKRLARQGLAVWSDATGKAVDAQRFQADARAFGYGEMDDALLLDVVRMRFRPWADGPLDADDCAVMADLAHRYGLEKDRSAS